MHSKLVMDVTKAIGLKLCLGCDAFHDESTTRFVEHKHFTEVCEGCAEHAEMREQLDQVSTIEEINGRWTCTACDYEWSAMMGDDEVPEICECQHVT